MITSPPLTLLGRRTSFLRCASDCVRGHGGGAGGTCQLPRLLSSRKDEAALSSEVHKSAPVEPGSTEWIAAVREFEADHGYPPWAVVGDDGWCVSRFEDGPGVAWTAAGVRALQQRTIDTPGAYAFWGGLLNQLREKGPAE